MKRTNRTIVFPAISLERRVYMRGLTEYIRVKDCWETVDGIENHIMEVIKPSAGTTLSYYLYDDVFGDI